jgi:hypothetical protein
MDVSTLFPEDKTPQKSLFSSAADEERLDLIVVAADRLFDRCDETIRCTDTCVWRWLWLL